MKTSLFYQVIGKDLKVQPCAKYADDAQPDPNQQHDPLRALIDGKLTQNDNANGPGTPINIVFL